MIRLDLQTLTAQAFNRLAADALGADVRAALGAGAGSLIPATALDDPLLPPTPFGALRRLPVGGITDEMRSIQWVWWFYDDPAQGYWRINRIASLTADAYPEYSMEYGRLTTALGGEDHDNALGLVFTTVRVIYTRRG